MISFAIAGPKALNKTRLKSTSSYSSKLRDAVSFVTVFTVYNNTSLDARASDLVTVGNASYSKTERSIAVLNVFVNFIQVLLLCCNFIICQLYSSVVKFWIQHLYVELV